MRSVEYSCPRFDVMCDGSQYFLNMPDAVAAVVRHEGEILLVRQRRRSVERGLLELPGGRIEEGETAEEAVLREVLEEVGARASQAVPLLELYPLPSLTRQRVSYFVIDADEVVDPLPQSDEEDIEAVAVAEEELWDLVASGEVQSGMELVGMYAYLAKAGRQDAAGEGGATQCE